MLLYSILKGAEHNLQCQKIQEKSKNIYFLISPVHTIGVILWQIVEDIGRETDLHRDKVEAIQATST